MNRRHESIITTAQSTYPVTATEAKLYMGVEGTTDDDLINVLIPAATKFFQDHTGHQTTQVTYTQKWDGWPCHLELDWSPVASVTWLKYYDVDGTLTTVSSSDYWTSLNARPPRIIPAYGVSWPSTQVGRPEAVQVQYVAGYAAVSDMAQGIRVAILELVKLWYTTRTPILTDGAYPSEVPYTLRALMDVFNLRGYR